MTPRGGSFSVSERGAHPRATRDVSAPPVQDRPNWLAVEAELTPAQRRALAEHCRALGVDRARWHDVPVLRQLHVLTAVSQLADRLLEEGAATALTPARVEAAVLLGVNEKTVESGLHRARQAASAEPSD